MKLETIKFNIEKVMQDFPILKNIKNNKSLVYLDSAATSQKPLQVINRIKKFYEEENANIHRCLYDLSTEATKNYEDVKEIVANFINADKEEIIFTKSTTESLNLVAYSLLQELNEGDEIILSISEHHSNLVPWQQLSKRYKLKVNFAKLNENLEIDVDNLKSLVNKKTKVIAVNHVSNTTGVKNNIKEIAEIAKENNIYLVVDAAQSAPHFKLDVKELGVDFLAFSGHKMLAPTGIGVLFGKKELLQKISPFIYGGGMIKEVSLEDTRFDELPGKFEAGTQNISGAIALGESIKYLEEIGMDNIDAYIEELTTYALEKLNEISGLKVYGKGHGIISFNIDKIHPHDLSSLLNEDNIAVRGGHHCCMPLMKYLGINGTVRVSLYIYNNKEDIDKLVESLRKAIKFFE